MKLIQPITRRCTQCNNMVLTLRSSARFRCGSCELSSKREWSAVWSKALANMPCMAVCKLPEGYYTDFYRRGAATALRICLGYHCYAANGRSNAQGGVHNAITRGQVPKGYARQNLLRALAGHHGPTLARARLIQLGQDHRFKIWPMKGT